MNHLYFRLATSEAGLTKGYLFTQGLPPPQPDFNDYSVKVSQSDGGEARHGYQNVTLLWEALTRSQGARLRQLVEDSNGTIYATFPRADGKSAGWDYIDVSGVPLIPDMAPSAVPQARGGWVYQNVQLVIRNITIVNDPASF
jgi:hypothetical protein